MMTLDEAIEHANQIADSYKDTVPNCECAKEHRQLAKWLTELKMARVCAFAEIPQMAQTINENHELKAENERLRQELAIREESEQEKTIESLRQENVDWEDRYRALASDNARLRSELESVGTAAYLYGRTDLADENAKLRELARGLGQCAQGVGCEDCLLYDRSEPDHCREERLSRELGVEMNDV